MENKKSVVTSIVVLVVVIILGVWVYSKKPAGENTTLIAPVEDYTLLTYPEYYPEELMFDLSVIEKISETKDANGKNVVKVEYTSLNPITKFIPAARNILEFNKWTITEGGTGDGPSINIVAVRGAETVTVNLTKSGEETAVKINYQQ